MLLFLSFLVKIIFNLAGSRRSLLIRIALLEKELEILQRKNLKKRLIPKRTDRIIFVIMNLLFNIKGSTSIFKPDTILKWQRNIIKGHWTFKSKKKNLWRSSFALFQGCCVTDGVFPQDGTKRYTGLFFKALDNIPPHKSL